MRMTEKRKTIIRNVLNDRAHYLRSMIDTNSRVIANNEKTEKVYGIKAVLLSTGWRSELEYRSETAKFIQANAKRVEELKEIEKMLDQL